MLVACMACTVNKATMTLPKTMKPDALYQYGIIDGLLAGVFDGNLTIKSLRKQGDFGIGTFNHADGELIALMDTVYKVKFDGSVETVSDKDSTPLAFVKHFAADTTIYLKDDSLSFEKMQQQLTSILNANSMYAIKVSGVFKTMTTRAAAPAQRPYPTLSEHLKTAQNIFNLTNTSGDCVGFLLPPYMAKTNVPGYHFHFLSADKRTGGHVFAFTASELRIEIDEINAFYIENNTHPDFRKVNLKEDRAAELKRIE
jgi:acetolactate decarboxylase